MAVKQGEPWVVGDKINIHTAEAFNQDGVFENSGCFFPMDFRDLKIMPVQVERMHVVALVYESESITAPLMYLEELTEDALYPFACRNSQAASETCIQEDLRREITRYWKRCFWERSTGGANVLRSRGVLVSFP